MTKEKIWLESAFPFKQKYSSSFENHPGMSKRFYAACAAMQGILSNSSFIESFTAAYPNRSDAPSMKKHLIALAYDYSDELLRQEKL